MIHSKVSLRHGKDHIVCKPRSPEPNFVIFDIWEELLVSDSILVAYYGEFLPSRLYPRKELSEKGKRWVRHDDIRLITEPLHLFRTEIPIAFQVLPLQILNIDAAISGGVAFQDENLAVSL